MVDSSLFWTLQVDFIWINRDQKSFEWFVSLLTKLEMDQADEEPEGEKDTTLYKSSTERADVHGPIRTGPQYQGRQVRTCVLGCVYFGVCTCESRREEHVLVSLTHGLVSW